MSAKVGGVDVATGAKGGDGFGAAIAEAEGDVVVLRAVRLYQPSFSPEAVVGEVAGWMRSHGVHEVVGDRFAGELPRDAFRRHGIEYRVSDLDTSAVYLELLALVNSGRVRLLDHPELLRQLRGLERMRGRGGQDRVDHRRGAHDDLAAAAAQAIVHAARGLRQACQECDWPGCQGYHISVAGAPPRYRRRAEPEGPKPGSLVALVVDAVEPDADEVFGDPSLDVVVGIAQGAHAAAAVVVIRDADVVVLLRHRDWSGSVSVAEVAAQIREWAGEFHVIEVLGDETARGVLGLVRDVAPVVGERVVAGGTFIDHLRQRGVVLYKAAAVEAAAERAERERHYPPMLRALTVAVLAAFAARPEEARR